jgi:rhodanese-related sulfurtransferase
MEKQSCISPDQVRKQLEKGGCIRILDVRSQAEYEERHIPGAFHIPLDALEKSVSLFDSKSILIAVCGKGGGRSAEGAEILRRLGFESSWLCGGTVGWFE